MLSKKTSVDFNIKIVYEDNHIIVVQKPAGMSVQGNKDIYAPNLLDIIKKYLKTKYNKPGKAFAGLVHRLDRPVGGVMVFAKTSKAASRLCSQIRDRTFKKVYLAAVNKKLEGKRQLKHYLKKDNKKNYVKAFSSLMQNAKEAVLDYESLEVKDNLSLLAIRLHTGRPHQIRVQMSAIGHPLCGDKKYGGKSDKNVDSIADSIALWSYKIGFLHPVQQKFLEFKLTPPITYPWTLFSSALSRT